MTNILIQKEQKPKILTLRAVTSKEKLLPQVNKKDWWSTLVHDKNLCYLYVDKENSDYNFSCLYEYFVGWAETNLLKNDNKKSWNVDIKSFVSRNLSEELVIQAISEGILYGSHQLLSYKSEKEREKNLEYYLVTRSKRASEILKNSFLKLEAVNFARDLQDASPNNLHAKEFAEEIQQKFKKLNGIKVEVLDKKQIEKNKMGLLLAVNAGSHHEPRVVILKYSGNPKSKEILGLVGKGITFDSGGYDLKPSQYLQCMKFDMSGAAVVCASILALANKKPKINVVVIACLTENAIGGHATLTESVITSMSGKTVEINNTDAEGRLVLADGITYAIQKEKVSKIITIATLTGACVSALGENITGTMTNNRSFYQKFDQATYTSQEKIWELPLVSENTKNLKEKTTIADISNISTSRYMGASHGAAFLQYFVNDLPFIHCDIAGTAWKTKTKRGTGVMTKTLIDLFQEKNKLSK